MERGTELGKWAQDVKLDLIYCFEYNSNQWLGSPPKKTIAISPS